MYSSHSAGDVLMVQPSNLADVVEEFITFFALDPNRTFLLEQNDPGIFLQTKLLLSLMLLNVVVFVYSLNVIITVVIVVCDWVFFVIVIITPITISLLLSPPLPPLAPPPSTSSSSSSSSSSWTWKALARFTYQFYEKNIDLSCSSQSTIIVLWYPVFPHSCISWKAPGFICTRIVSLRFDPQKWWLLENSDL